MPRKYKLKHANSISEHRHASSAMYEVFGGAFSSLSLHKQNEQADILCQFYQENHPRFVTFWDAARALRIETGGFLNA